MNLRLANIRFGLTTLLITAGIGGMMLGGTFNEFSVQEGNHVLGLARFFLREGHSHGNFMAIFNILVGLLLNNLNLSERMKKICSYSAMASILLPLGLFVKGTMGASDDAPPFGLLGVVGVVLALVILIIGAFKTK
ncbi:MAG: hypothetical protein RIC15_08340 [Vicingaceae bacterium]